MVQIMHSSLTHHEHFWPCQWPELASYHRWPCTSQMQNYLNILPRALEKGWPSVQTATAVTSFPTSLSSTVTLHAMAQIPANSSVQRIFNSCKVGGKFLKKLWCCNLTQVFVLRCPAQVFIIDNEFCHNTVKEVCRYTWLSTRGSPATLTMLWGNPDQ